MLKSLVAHIAGLSLKVKIAAGITAVILISGAVTATVILTQQPTNPENSQDHATSQEKTEEAKTETAENNEQNPEESKDDAKTDTTSNSTVNNTGSTGNNSSNTGGSTATPTQPTTPSTPKADYNLNAGWHYDTLTETFTNGVTKTFFVIGQSTNSCYYFNNLVGQLQAYANSAGTQPTSGGGGCADLADTVGQGWGKTLTEAACGQYGLSCGRW